MPDESEKEVNEDLYDSLFDGVEDVSSDSNLTEDPTEFSGFWYPSVEEIIEIHDDIVEEDPESQTGIEHPDRIQFAIDYIEHGAMGEKPESVHEKAFTLMRLIASNHWFVDGNKRTALNTTNLFYLLNGYDLEYGEDLRAMLKLLAVRERLIDREAATEYLADQTSAIDEETLFWLAVLEIGDALLEGVESQDLGNIASGNDSDSTDHNS